MLGYDESYILNIHIRDLQNYQRLQNALIQAGLHLTPSESWQKNLIVFENSDLGSINDFLNVIATNSVDLPDFQEIKQAILRDLNNNPLATPPLAVFRPLLYNYPARTPETSRALSPPPEAGENHRKIVALGVEESNLPEDFFCKLTYYVMTDPVYDSDTPDIKWDRPNILRCLASKHVNPFTRKSLRPEDLIADTSLKGRIELYIKNEEKNKNEEKKISGNKVKMGK